MRPVYANCEHHDHKDFHLSAKIDFHLIFCAIHEMMMMMMMIMAIEVVFKAILLLCSILLQYAHIPSAYAHNVLQIYSIHFPANC